MTPFPETEIMTLKRLEVAIRKMDFKLLKDGAYKLHEKYHSGHRFEYVDLIKEIYSNIMNNNSIPAEIKDILIPTIEDVLERSGVNFERSENEINNQINEEENVMPQRVSSLTSLSYNTDLAHNKEVNSNSGTVSNTAAAVINENKEENKIDAFSAFSNALEYEKEHEKEVSQENPIQNPVQNPIQNHENLTQNPIVNNSLEQNNLNFSANEQTLNLKPQEEKFEQQGMNLTQPFQEFSSITYPKTPETMVQKENIEVQPMVTNQTQSVFDKPLRVEKEIKSVSILFLENNSKEKIKNITRLNELISSERTKEVDLFEMINIISELKIQTNSNTAELKNILEQFRLKDNKINLITNSQTSNLVNLLKDMDMTFSFVKRKETKNLNLLPLMGLSNLYSCPNCQEKYLQFEDNSPEPLVLLCPKCKSPMYPTLYALAENVSNLNMTYYNYAVSYLANTKVWLLIHPVLGDEFIINLLKTALSVSSDTKEIYIFDKDINTKETYKKALLECFEEGKYPNIDIQLNSLENFFGTLK